GRPQGTPGTLCLAAVGRDVDTRGARQRRAGGAGHRRPRTSANLGGGTPAARRIVGLAPAAGGGARLRTGAGRSASCPRLPFAAAAAVPPCRPPRPIPAGRPVRKPA